MLLIKVESVLMGFAFLSMIIVSSLPTQAHKHVDSRSEVFSLFRCLFSNYLDRLCIICVAVSCCDVLAKQQ